MKLPPQFTDARDVYESSSVAGARRAASARRTNRPIVPHTQPSTVPDVKAIREQIARFGRQREIYR